MERTLFFRCGTGHYIKIGSTYDTEGKETYHAFGCDRRKRIMEDEHGPVTLCGGPDRGMVLKEARSILRGYLDRAKTLKRDQNRAKAQKGQDQ